MAEETFTQIKLGLRVSHSKLDTDIRADIEACIADLQMAGVIYADDTDPLVFNAIKLWCRSLYTDDMGKAAQYMERYEKLKACLMMAEGYGWKDDSNE